MFVYQHKSITRIAGLHPKDIANAWHFVPAVQIDDDFLSTKKYMNMGREMVMQIDHDLVTVDTKNCRHQDTRKAKRLGYCRGCNGSLLAGEEVEVLEEGF